MTLSSKKDHRKQTVQQNIELNVGRVLGARDTQPSLFIFQS
jgi:hypothetical protein